MVGLHLFLLMLLGAAFFCKFEQKPTLGSAEFSYEGQGGVHVFVVHHDAGLGSRSFGFFEKKELDGEDALTKQSLKPTVGPSSDNLKVQICERTISWVADCSFLLVSPSKSR
jgi:hypothetical protein